LKASNDSVYFMIQFSDYCRGSCEFHIHPGESLVNCRIYQCV